MTASLDLANPDIFFISFIWRKKKVNHPCPAKLPFGPQGGSKWATSPKNTEKTGFSLKKHLLTIVRQSNVWQLLKILSWRTQWCSYFWSQGHLKVIKGHFKVILGHFLTFSLGFQHICPPFLLLPKMFFLTRPVAGFTGKKTFWGGEEKVGVANLFFSEQNVLGWAGYPMGWKWGKFIKTW